MQQLRYDKLEVMYKLNNTSVSEPITKDYQYKCCINTCIDGHCYNVPLYTRFYLRLLTIHNYVVSVSCDPILVGSI